MKIVSSSDWRDAIAFDAPVLVADVVPGEPTRCVGCGAEGELVDRGEWWAVKHRHPKHHGDQRKDVVAEARFHRAADLDRVDEQEPVGRNHYGRERDQRRASRGRQKRGDFAQAALRRQYVGEERKRPQRAVA